MPKGAKKSSKTVESDLKKAEKALNKAAKRIERAGIRDYMDYMASPWKLLAINFLVGTARGLGLILGVSLVLTLAGLVVSKLLADIPYIGEFFVMLYQFLIEQTQNGLNGGGGNMPG
ncbi:hypothetical protein HOG48_02270 [Candidatus Peregrinibacteria bacterium]|jgi:hypothetical protein|nr:hypothetical protein [Candidatus Peregrinibacteria bacterium]